MPSYCAVELSSFLPLITVSRILLVVVFFSYVFSHRGKIKISFSQYNKSIRRAILIYSVFLCMANVAYITETSEAIKAIFTVIFEELFLVWIIQQMISSRIKLIACLEIMVYASGITAVLGIIESFTGFNVFYSLNTVQREMLMASFSRMGMQRAETGFGHAVYYGTYCAVMIPICMYFIENYSWKKWKYYLCLTLNLIALFLANSRGSILSAGCILLYMLFTKKQHELVKYKNYALVICISLIFVAIIKPSILTFMGNIIQSVIDALTSDSSTIENYGINESGMASRLGQFSGILWTLKNNPLWGLSANANKYGLVSYLTNQGIWAPTSTFDMGYIAIFCQYGIVGSIGYIVLFGTIIKKLCSRINEDDRSLQRMFKYAFATYFLCLLSVSSVQKLLWVLIALFVAYLNIFTMEKAHRDNCIETTDV